MATHSSILAWRIPWTEEPGGLQSMGSHRLGHDWRDLANTYVLVFILKDPVLQRTLVPGLSPESAACVGSPQPQRWLGLLGQEFSHLGGCPSRTPALLSCRTSGSTATVWKNYKRWSERGGSLSSHQLSVKWEGSASLLSHVSHVRLCATPWMVARQAPLSMGFSRQW